MRWWNCNVFGFLHQKILELRERNCHYPEKRGTYQEKHTRKDNFRILQRVYNETLRIEETHLATKVKNILAVFLFFIF